MAAQAKIAAAAASVSLALACAAGPRGRLEKDVVFDAYVPLARSEEILRRIMTPLGFQRARRALAARGQELADRPVDLARERFTVYVPAGAPPAAGWGLLVFVAPWPQATEPRRWRAPLDRHGIVLVSAAGAGNESNVYERRLPLALLAYENVRARLPVDPARVYVGGFSGGARVAEAIALAYPDLFRGALLHAGSEPIGGERGLHLPRADLFRRFQETRIVYTTGGEDEARLEDDRVSQASLRSWCVLDQDVVTPPRLGHALLGAAWLDRALEALERPSAPDPARRATCDDGLRRALSGRLAEVEAAIARGDRAAARAQLDALDRDWGGLAAPTVLELDARLGT